MGSGSTMEWLGLCRASSGDRLRSRDLFFVEVRRHDSLREHASRFGEVGGGLLVAAADVGEDEAAGVGACGNGGGFAGGGVPAVVGFGGHVVGVRRLVDEDVGAGGQGHGGGRGGGGGGGGKGGGGGGGGR